MIHDFIRLPNALLVEQKTKTGSQAFGKKVHLRNEQMTDRKRFTIADVRCGVLGAY